MCLDIAIKYTPATILIILAVIIGLFTFVQDRGQYEYCDGIPYTIEGEIEKTIYANDHYGKHIVKLDKIDGQECNHKIVVTESLGTLSKNDKIVATVYFTKLQASKVGFDSAGYYVDDGILIECEIKNLISSSKGKDDMYDFFKKSNTFLDEILKSKLSEDTYPLASALILGNRDKLPDDVTKDFTRLGIVHILSLSGMHVSIIITMLCFALSKSGLPKLTQILISTFSLTFFIAISGFSEPALRAGLMQILFFLLILLRDEADTISSLFVSVTLICIFSPYLIFSVSLMLSFLAMLGCICSAKLLYKSRLIYKVRYKPLRFCILTFVTTTGVTLISLPIIYLYFGVISYASVFSNILIVPLLNVVIYLLPIVLILSPVGFISNPLSYICDVICKLVISLCDNTADIDGICFSIVGNIQLVGVFIIFASCILLLALSKKQIKYSFIVLGVGIIVLISGIIGVTNYKRNHTLITSYSVIENDVICIERDNSLTVIDISSHSLSHPLPKDMSDYLGYCEVDNYIALTYSHTSKDYFDKITDNVVINNIYLISPLTENEEKYYKEAIALLNQKKIGYTEFNTTLTINEISIDICEEMIISRSKKRSLVFSIEIEKIKYTYLGASAFELASVLPDKYVKNSDALIIGAYGPNYKKKYNYDTSSLQYVVFLGGSEDFASGAFLDSVYEKSTFEELYTIGFSNNY